MSRIIVVHKLCDANESIFNRGENPIVRWHHTTVPVSFLIAIKIHRSFIGRELNRVEFTPYLRLSCYFLFPVRPPIRCFWFCSVIRSVEYGMTPIYHHVQILCVILIYCIRNEQKKIIIYTNRNSSVYFSFSIYYFVCVCT